MNDLAHLRLVDALSNNAAVVVIAVLAGLAWLAWLRAAAQRRRLDWPGGVKPWTAYVAVAALVAFSVVRNLPFGAWLAPELLT